MTELWQEYLMKDDCTNELESGTPKGACGGFWESALIPMLLVPELSAGDSNISNRR
jgi:hypothetical protein